MLHCHILRSAFCQAHRKRPEDFTRTREGGLPFVLLVVLQLRLMMSSLQRNLEELLEAVAGPQDAMVTASAISQARAKLRHTAFIELNELCVREFYQKCPCVLRWRGYVVTAVDGSTVALPRNAALAAAFGGMKPHKGDFRPKARLLERYDVLNHVSLQAIIAPYRQGERTLLKEHLKWDLADATKLEASHVITLYDRGFAALGLLRHHAATGTPFVLRLPARWWKLARHFTASMKAEEEFTLRAGGDKHRLRLVRVETGNPEEPAVLVTNLLERADYPAECFGELYALRWGVESGYKLLKCRAQLEDWSAKTEEGIRQDFHAKVMTLSLSAALSAGADEHIRSQSRRAVDKGKAKHTQQINRTHALAAVCRHLPRLLWRRCRGMLEATLRALNGCFQRARCLVRPGRSNPRPQRAKRMPPSAYKNL